MRRLTRFNHKPVPVIELKNQHCRNLVVSYIIGCMLTIACVISTSSNNYDSNEFIFGFYLFLFCQLFIWEPLSICTILFISRMGISPSVLDNLWQCVLYGFLPSFLMQFDAFCGNVWIRQFKVDSIFLLFFVYLTYYIATIIIAVLCKPFISGKKSNGRNSDSEIIGTDSADSLNNSTF